MQRYETYYPVDFDYVDELPVGWKLLPNIAIFDERIQRGNVNEELLAVTIRRGIIKQSELKSKKDISNEDKSAYKLVKKGDLAYNKMRMWQGSVGHSQYQGIVSPAYIVLKPKIPINPKFFHYQYRSKFYINYCKRASYGICDDQLSLRYKDFKRMLSIVPPLEIQNEIVAYLDKKLSQVARLNSNKQLLIKKLKIESELKIEKWLTKGLRNEDLIKLNEKYLPLMPASWSFSKVKHLSKIGPAKNNPRFHKNSSEEVVFLPMENIEADGTFSNSDKRPAKDVWEGFTYFSKGDIAIAKITPCFENGKGAFLDNLETEIGFGTTELIVLRPNLKKVRPLFLYHFLHSQRFRTIGKENMTGTAGQQRISPSFVSNFPIAIPQSFQEQDAIINRIENELRDKSNLIGKINLEIERANKYSESLIERIVTGRNIIYNSMLSIAAEPNSEYGIKEQ